jgi:stage IV sporulation protein B
MRRSLFIFLAVAVLLSSAFIFVIRPISAAAALPDEIILTDAEYTRDRPIVMTKFLTAAKTQSSAVGGDTKKYITIKLLGFIPIKKVLINTLPIDTVLIGGMPIGIAGKIDGVLVCDDYSEYKLKKGDVITAVNGNKIHSAQDFASATEDKQNVTVQMLRNNKTVGGTIAEPETLSTRDSTAGVGILTFVNPQNNNFSALGHQMGDFDTGASINLRGGEIKAVNTFGIEKTVGQKTGVIKSSLKSSSPSQGSIIRGDRFGICGCLTADSEILKLAATTMPIATRYNVRPGKAILRTSLDSAEIEEFECEILKTRFQNKKADKSMVIRLTDERLLSKTGGILHGMSGSPIIQNGHLVGALTHATTHDPAKGYAVYIDFVAI